MAHRERSAARGKRASKKRAAGRRRSLFEHWETISRRLRAASRIALFLDFDGTLAPIAAHPDKVVVGVSTRRLLRRLVRLPGVKVYVISGRREADVRRQVGVAAISYLGLHGWERSHGNRLDGELRRFMQRLRERAEARLRGLEGIWVQDKSIAFVVHYRRAPASSRRRAWSRTRRVLGKAPGVRLMHGKMVWEILPAEIPGKGAAVRALLHESKERPLPIYLGDDTTDEAAFAVLPRGITVRVGAPRPTRARYTLRNPAEVLQFLEKLKAEVS